MLERVNAQKQTDFQNPQLQRRHARGSGFCVPLENCRASKNTWVSAKGLETQDWHILLPYCAKHGIHLPLSLEVTELAYLNTRTTASEPTNETKSLAHEISECPSQAWFEHEDSEEGVSVNAP